MAESHVISGLVAKRGELDGEIDYHQKLINGISDQLKALDAAIKVFDPEYKLRNIKAKKYHRKNHFFRHGEGNTLLMDLMREAGGEITTPQIVDKAARLKGLSLTDVDRKSFSASLFTILKRLQGKGIVEEVGRVDNVIRWALVSTR